MSKILKLKKGSLAGSMTKVVSGIATNYLMVFADKSIPILAKNKFVTPLVFFLGSLGAQVATKPGSMQANISDGINIIAGVDLLNALVDLGRQQMIAQNNNATTTNADAGMGRTKNPTRPYFNPARG